MFAPKEYEWHKIAEQAPAFATDEIKEMTVGNKLVCLAKHGDKILACQGLCPHAGVPLVDGYVDIRGNIVCPLHHYKFNLETGRNVSGEGYLMRTYPIEERADGIYMGIEKK